MPSSAKSDSWQSQSVFIHIPLWSLLFCLETCKLPPPLCPLACFMAVILRFCCCCHCLFVSVSLSGPEYKSQRKSQTAILPPILICCLWPTVDRDDWKCPPAILELETWNNFNLWSLHKWVSTAQRIVDIYFFLWFCVPSNTLALKHSEMPAILKQRAPYNFYLQFCWQVQQNRCIFDLL